jgi:hypothetical protein
MNPSLDARTRQKVPFTSPSSAVIAFTLQKQPKIVTQAHLHTVVSGEKSAA